MKLPAILSDHMVLQRDARVPIWGWAAPDEAITVTLGPQSASTAAGADGRWRVDLDLANSASGPFDLVVRGATTITVRDVLVGEVWLASGQSNMEWPLKDSLDAESELAASENPQMREFRVTPVASAVPLDDCEGKWVVAGPKTVGDFSAVAYFFGKCLQRELRGPVGIIHSSWGATPAEAWTSRESLDTVPALAANTRRHLDEAANHDAARQKFLPAFADWLRRYDREDRAMPSAAAFAAPDLSTEDWIPVRLDAPLSAPDLPETGAIWFRREVVISPDEMRERLARRKALDLDLGDVTGFEEVYWNGELLGATSPATFPGLRYSRAYTVPLEKIRTGRNVLAVRVFAPLASPTFAASPVHPPGTTGGEWRAKAEYAFPPLEPAARAVAPTPPRVPWPPRKYGAHNFNGMIAPLIPYALRGAIWYQGEGNAGRAVQYRAAFPLLIEDWRRRWQRGDFPFYFCQIANWREKAAQPGESESAELREAQHLALRLPHTGEAVLIDLGEARDVHPRNKRDVGERLARIALARDYGKDVAWSGPVFQSMQQEGDKIRLRFRHAEGGLAAAPLPPVYDLQTLLRQTAPLVRHAPHGALEGFAICGPDRRWVWAGAEIEGDTVLVGADAVRDPVAVRYGWADNPTCNLVNGAGLPASPFRTDDFPAVTRDAVDW